MKRVIFVCTGNTCRSPMAEYLLRDQLEQQSGKDLEVESAGVNASPGARASGSTRQVLKAEGISGIDQHRAKPVNRLNPVPGNGDLVLAMTPEHREYLENLWPETGADIYTLNGYVDCSVDLSDPYGGSLERYRRLLDELKPAVAEIADTLVD